MVTNFEHLKPWENIYEYALEMEDLMLQATSKRKCGSALAASRRVLEAMLKKMVQVAGFTNNDIMRFQAQAGTKAARDQNVSNFGRILALASIGVFSRESIDNMHFLRKKGNVSSHSEEALEAVSLNQLQKETEEVYAKMYKESYLFAHQYMPLLEQKGLQGDNYANAVKRKQKRDNQLKIVILIVFVIIMVAIFTWAYYLDAQLSF